MKKTHAQVSQEFLHWASSQLPGAFVFQNSSGYASKERVRYGLPNTGGGYDYVAFLPGGVTEFYEVKTNAYPTLSPKQKRFSQNMTAQGFKCFVFREGQTAPVDWAEYQPTMNREVLKGA